MGVPRLPFGWPWESPQALNDGPSWGPFSGKEEKKYGK